MIPLEQLSVYLPYKLKGILTCSHEDDFYGQDWADLSKFQQDCIWQLAGYTDKDLNVPLGEGEYHGFLWRNEYTYVCFHSGIKPLLHPLSKIEEEPFINELYEFYGGGYSSFKAFKTDWIYGIYQDCPDRLSFEIIQYMAKKHIDIFNLISQGLAEPIK